MHITIGRDHKMNAAFKIVADGFGLHMNSDGRIIEVQPAIEVDSVLAAFENAGIEANLVKEKIFMRGGVEVVDVLLNCGATNLLADSLVAIIDLISVRPEIFAEVAADDSLRIAADAVRSLLPHANIHLELGHGDDMYSESYQPVPASAEEISTGPVSELAPEIAQALGIAPKGKGRGR
jgi:hypothetical protein